MDPVTAVPPETPPPVIPVASPTMDPFTVIDVRAYKELDPFTVAVTPGLIVMFS
jgi:hypothetical protein